MIKLAGHLKEYRPNQLNVTESSGLVMRMLMTLQGASADRIPELLRDQGNLTPLVKRPARRERTFPIVAKERPQKYGKTRKNNQSVA
ncbi:hypothetical protein PEC302107_16290 [Pectobacterium araliae]|nr:hypothetical protein PEC302107_16290 [Pectobacterium carotovorum subsp. carotovorum]